MSRDTAMLVETLAAWPNGLTRAEFLAAQRKQNPTLSGRRLEQAIGAAGDSIVEREGRLFACATADETDLADLPDGMPDRAKRPLRIVAVDTESVVRLTTEEPYTEPYLYQLGAVRFGWDRDWINAQRSFVAYVCLPDAVEALLEKPTIKERYLAQRRPANEVLERFRSYIAEADVLVAYNGACHDFPLIDKEYERADLEQLTGHKRVDGLYLAHAIWPVPPRQHRLRQLAERLRIDVGGAIWHDALDDARVLSILIKAGVRSYSRLSPALQSLVAAAGNGSEAWETLLALLPDHKSPQVFTDEDVSRLLRQEMKRLDSESVYPHRLAQTAKEIAAIHQPLAVPEWLRGSGPTGTVDVHLLASAAKQRTAEPRPSQKAMVEAMCGWVRDGINALVEAPTGTGKSYVLLAVALEWLVADPKNRVVISTFTKQLQNQIADDVEALSRPDALPEMVDLTGMVKGSRNRLSLRALVVALSDLTGSMRRPHRRNVADFSRDPRYRDLVIYLFLRLIAGGKLTEVWESRSVDPVDVPAFFDDYCGKRINLYLLSLSQALAGEFESTSDGLAAYTATVRDALNQHRLVIANHALLFAHLDDFNDIRAHTLLMIDEAHALENAATAALSPDLDYPAIEMFVSDLAEWLDNQSPSETAASAVVALQDLQRYLESEMLPIAAMKALSTAGGDPLGRSYLRRVSVASPMAGAAYGREMTTLIETLRDAARYLHGLVRSAYSLPAPLDPFERERFWSLIVRLKELTNAAWRIVRDSDAARGRSTPDPPQGTGSIDEDEGTAAGEDFEDDFARGPSNRIVWAEELDEWDSKRGKRAYRFRITSSPIELGREDTYRRFVTAFARSYFISATLRVGGQWDFIRQRLALSAETVREIELPSPFDAARQARLVCFDDFPSWTEQTEGAIRTVAHQVAGYAREVIQGGQNGAMLLTTSKAAAAGIAGALIRLRAAPAATCHLTSTELLGNQRAVDTFREVGGVLVGTKGLWQGVDIAQPDRLRLVWINKLPFAPFNDPIISARKELVRDQAEMLGVEDPDAYANEHYYLPLAALELRQAVGRLIRSRDHRGVIIVSDRKLAGPTRLRRLYREIFLGSLDPGLLGKDPEIDNIVSMATGWRRIWEFFAAEGIIDPSSAAELSTDEALDAFTQLPETRAIRQCAFAPGEEEELRARGPEVFSAALVERASKIGGYLKLRSEPVLLKNKQKEALDAIARGKDLFAVLPTGYGKSFVFQLPALVLPGVTVVISPLVALMTDQALELNRTIGDAVRALVAPMRESNSRTGKMEIHQQLTDPGCRHGIRIIYLSPERLCQRQFQDWIRTGVERGIVRRIAVDEAHTFVQWGDDFRPGFRRAEQFLRDLKRTHPGLQLIAVTATANAPVREGIRRAIFGLEADVTDPPSFAYVSANPLRPELAIYRRTLGSRDGSHNAVSGLVERVAEQIDDHAIFYCLTVREVDALYAHLRDFFAGKSDRIRKYHGRMTEVEKTSVANEFKSMPKRGEEGFRPMIVVATSAFGLGIDRPDIRTVFVASPPTDLAALYQQLGRAGRDQAGETVLERKQTTGLALATNKAFRTIQFMTAGNAVNSSLLIRMAGVILNASSPLDTRQIACEFVQEDRRAGRLTGRQAETRSTEDQYHIGLIRALSELAAADLIDDLGDFPAVVAIKRGEVPPDTADMAKIVGKILAMPTVELRSVHLDTLYQRLEPEFGDELQDHGALWSLLLNLHTLGYLDVSQAPNVDKRYLTAIRVRCHELTPEVVKGLGRRQETIGGEITKLIEWFKSTDCANDGLRRYFGVHELPVGTCETAECRCSACWAQAGRICAGDREPELLEAFQTHRPQPAGVAGNSYRRSQELLDRYVERLLSHEENGLSKGIIQSVLSGDEFYFNRSRQRREILWPRLLASSVRNARPGLREDELDRSLSRLEERKIITRISGLWILTRNLARHPGVTTTRSAASMSQRG